MSVVLQGTFEPVAATWSWESLREGRPVEIRDRIAARTWLARVASASGGMMRLRRLAADRLVIPAYGIDDGEVLDRLAGWLASGELRLVALGQQHLTSSGDVDEPAAIAAPMPAPAPVVETPKALEERTFGDEIDAEAIAVVMRNAAKLGIPFCEECTKKKRQSTPREARA
ncbi:Hypothetical protein A7982_07726 [Minicystis rosea]|nr:Hypothetical protein A7982_07726 [Minicystis rosea]